MLRMLRMHSVNTFFNADGMRSENNLQILSMGSHVRRAIVFYNSVIYYIYLFTTLLPIRQVTNIARRMQQISTSGYEQ